jgi:hypothetical protein
LKVESVMAKLRWMAVRAQRRGRRGGTSMALIQRFGSGSGFATPLTRS